MSNAPAALQTILAVDDTPANLALLAALLSEDYRVTVATNGQKALELAVANPPDLVLLDIMMPVMSGYDVLEHMRKDERLRDIPVVVTSAVNQLESVIRCVELGAEDYLVKPFDQTLLRARVEASLEKKRLRDAVQAQAAELAEWNRRLEERVQEQLIQLERLDRLKGFFSQPVAEYILSSGGKELLKSHRSEVVVVFLDMRGFTAFTDRSEPEEVMEVLAQYHKCMGELILKYQGTLEHFAGDGMMVFFNDPIKLENPTLNAIRMALDMQRNFVPLRTMWRKRGYKLDLGIGFAHGYATLGAIGFEGRWDYGCIGGVSNLAARLCGEAKPEQILTNDKTLARIDHMVEAEALGEMMLKGMTHPVPVFSITGTKI
jgi:adenylate cyclase